MYVCVHFYSFWNIFVTFWLVDSDREKEMIIRQAFEQFIDTSLYPRRIISIIVQVVVDDGSVLSAAINAVCLALVDAGGN